jgi:transposase
LSTAPASHSSADCGEDLQSFRREVEYLRHELKRSQREIELLREVIRLMRLEKYGPSAEALSEGQFALLDQELWVEAGEVNAEAALPEQEKQATDEGKTRQRPVRTELPQHLPRRETILSCPPEQCRCQQCGKEKLVIGFDESERLGVEPAVYYVEVTKREKRACADCEEMGVSAAPLPERIVEKGLLTDEVAVDVIVSKMCDHLPLYRQVERMERACDYSPALSTLSDLMMRAGSLLRLVVDAQAKDLLAGGYIQADETRVSVQTQRTPGRNHQAYFWQYSSPNGPVVFEFRMGRERAGPENFLRDFRGTLQSDGYAAYDKIGGKGMIHVCCLAHIRRKFHDALQLHPGDAHARAVLEKIGGIYAIEREARELGLDAEARGELRRSKSVPLLGPLRELILAAQSKAPPKSQLGKACHYALKLWQRLLPIFENGRIEIDNNVAENAMRPVALGRKNWLHVGSEKAGPKLAALASVVETCKRHGIDVRAYLLDVLPRLANWPTHRVQELTPLAWQAAKASAAA